MVSGKVVYVNAPVAAVATATVPLNVHPVPRVQFVVSAPNVCDAKNVLLAGSALFFIIKLAPDVVVVFIPKVLFAAE